MSNEITVQNTDNSFLAKDNFEHAFRMAKMMATSQLVPKNYQDKPQDILIAMEMGRLLGLSPIYSIQNIAVINGKPCLYGDGILAVCSGRPDFENIAEEPILDKDNNVVGYSCHVKRKGRTVVTQHFTINQAQLAGLWGKAGPWKQYPERMMQLRARGFALRDSFADALGGVKMAEEVQDYSENTEINSSNKAHIKRAQVTELKDLIAASEKQGTNAPKPIQLDPETGEILPDELC